jgi:hypothetical protein
MKTKASLSLIMLFATVAFGQQKEQSKDTVNRIIIEDAYIQSGMVLGRNSSGMLSDFQKLAPKSTLLNNNFSGYTSSNEDNFGNKRNTAFSAMVGIKFRNKQQTAYKSNPLLRIGISYFSGSNLSSSFYKEDYKRYDTLTSAKTGQSVYMDSVTSRRYNMNYASEQLRLDVSLIFRTNAKARWSLFGGFGISSGFSFNSVTRISYNKNNYTEISPNGNNYQGYYSNRNEQTENFKNKSYFVASSFLPMGVDFRIGKKKEMWKKIHLYYEARPFISFSSLPELSTLVRSGVQSSLGLRVSW